MVQQQQGARLLVPSEANDGDQSLNKTNTTTIAAANNNRGHAEKDQSINYNGIVVAFGDNTHGQLGRGNDISLSFTPLVLDTLSPLKVTMLALGFLHSLALTTEGKVYSWGTSEDGSLGRTSLARLTFAGQVPVAGQVDLRWPGPPSWLGEVVYAGTKRTVEKDLGSIGEAGACFSIYGGRVLPFV